MIFIYFQSQLISEMITNIDQLDFSQKINIEVSRQIQGSILFQGEKSGLYTPESLSSIQQVYRDSFGRYRDLSKILEANKENIARIQANEENGIERQFELGLLDGKFRVDMPNIFWLFNDWTIQSKDSYDQNVVNPRVFQNFIVNIPQLSYINSEIKSFYFRESDRMVKNLKRVFIAMLAIQIAIQLLILFSVVHLLVRVVAYFKSIFSLVD